MKRIVAYILFLVLLGSCSKDKNEVKTSGDVLLSSQIMGNESGYFVEGFSIDNANKVNYTLTSSTTPDLVLENILDLQGNVIGANLTSPKNDAAFFKAGEFTSSSEAATFFNNLTDAGTNTYTPTAREVAVNQVYIFKSRANKYAKLLIKDYNVLQGPLSDYIQVTIQWVYQPNGEKTF